MSEPFLAEIRIFAGNFAPRGWAFCDGQVLPINQNQSLYSLLGTTFGGDGRISFALPDLRGRAPMHVGSGHLLGQKGGSETVTLAESELPSHSHGLNASSDTANARNPSGNLPASTGDATNNYRVSSSTTTTMNSGAIANSGVSQGHQNMQPFLVLHFIIALQGLFPSRN